MTLRRDRVNRVRGRVHLPGAAVTGDAVVPGDHVILTEVQENPIDAPYEIDPMAMEEPVNGDAIGDAIFDAMAPGVDDAIIDPEELDAGGDA